MNAISTLFGRLGLAPDAPKLASAEPEAPISDDTKIEGPPASEAWTEIGLRIGAEHEAVRSYMVDIGHRIDMLDDLRETFGKIVEPIDQALRRLEQEKFANVNLRTELDETRAAYETLGNESDELAKMLAESETETERLRNDLDQSQQSIAALEKRKIELTNELESVGAQLVELEDRLARESAAARIFKEHKEKLTYHAAAADKRVAELEDELGSARERLVLQEKETRSLQSSLDQMGGENAQLSRRLTESEASLNKAQFQIEQMKVALATAETERNRLTAEVDEANERRHAETNSLSTRLEAMSSRAAVLEKMLAEVRQSLLARTEENSAAERKLVDATVARNAADKKVELLQNSLQAKERQVEDLERLRAKLIERANTLRTTVKVRNTALARARDSIQVLTDRVARLEAEAKANHARTQERLAEQNSQLQSERLERTVAEGALQAARANNAELQRELDDYVRNSGRHDDRAQVRSTPKDPTPERIVHRIHVHRSA